jgi:hypothetical protein
MMREGQVAGSSCPFSFLCLYLITHIRLRCRSSVNMSTSLMLLRVVLLTTHCLDLLSPRVDVTSITLHRSSIAEPSYTSMYVTEYTIANPHPIDAVYQTITKCHPCQSHRNDQDTQRPHEAAQNFTKVLRHCQTQDLETHPPWKSRETYPGSRKSKTENTTRSGVWARTKIMIPLRLELRTACVLDRSDNQLHHRTS